MGCAPSRGGDGPSTQARVGAEPISVHAAPSLARSKSSPWVASKQRKNGSQGDLSWASKPSWAVKSDGSRRESDTRSELQLRSERIASPHVADLLSRAGSDRSNGDIAGHENGIPNASSPCANNTVKAPSRALECLAACLPRRLVRRNLEALGFPTDRDSSDLTAAHKKLQGTAPGRPRLQCSNLETALLFIDISGFTSSMERFAEHGGRGTERFWAAISTYMGALLREIYSRGGDVECFAGDALMVSFGADEVASHPMGSIILDRYLQQASPSLQTEGEARLAVAAKVAIDAAAAMLRHMSPYTRTEKDFSGHGQDLELLLTLHGSVGAGALTATELIQGQGTNKRWHFVCGPVVGQLARAHALSAANDCVLSRQAARAAGAGAWAEPLGSGRMRMRGPDFLPAPLLQPVISPVSTRAGFGSTASSLSGYPATAGEARSAAAGGSSMTKGTAAAAGSATPPTFSPGFSPASSSSSPCPKAAAAAVAAWPRYEVASLMTGKGLGETDFVAVAAALLAYVPEPLAVRFRQGLVVQDAALPQGEDALRSTPSLKPSVSWLGELRPAAVAFVKFNIGDINVDRTIRGALSHGGGAAGGGGGTSSSGGSVRGGSGATLTDCDSTSLEMDCCLYLQPERGGSSSSNADPNSSSRGSAGRGGGDSDVAAAAAAAATAADSPVQEEDEVRELRQTSAPVGMSAGAESLPNRKAHLRRRKLVVIGRACLAAAQAVIEQGGLVNKILMDEKGLCLIYAFGTPGSSFEDNPTRALRVGCTILHRLGHPPKAVRQGGSSSGGGGLGSSGHAGSGSSNRRQYGSGSRRSGGGGGGSSSSSSAAMSECTASIGVATGQVCAALLGLSTVRCEYALVGDTVNLAARLAAHATSSGFGMLACPATMAPLLGRGTLSFKQVEGAEEFKAEKVGQLRPKGKSSDISIYEVKPAPKRSMMRSAVDEVLSSPSHADGPAHKDPLRQRTHSLVLGRDIELQVVSECIVKACRGGSGGVIVLEADVGMGKSAIIRHFRRALTRAAPHRRTSSSSTSSNTRRRSSMTRGSHLLSSASSTAAPGSSSNGANHGGISSPPGTPAVGGHRRNSSSQQQQQQHGNGSSSSKGAYGGRSHSSATSAASPPLVHPPVVQARCAAMDQLQPLLVLSVLMQQIIALWMEPGEGGAYTAERFADVLNPEELKLVPLLRQLGVSLAGHGASLAPFRHLPPSEAGRLLLRLCACLVAATSEQFGALVIILDDLHFCDGGSLGALLNIFHGTEAPESATGVRQKPALSLILATRPEHYYPEHLRSMYRQLRTVAGGGLLVLGPLDDDYAVALACAALGVRELGDGLRRAICSTCQGNPFFIKEVCATLVDRGSVRIEDDSGESSSFLPAPATSAATSAAAAAAAAGGGNAGGTDTSPCTPAVSQVSSTSFASTYVPGAAGLRASDCSAGSGLTVHLASTAAAAEAVYTSAAAQFPLHPVSRAADRPGSNSSAGSNSSSRGGRSGGSSNSGGGGGGGGARRAVRMGGSGRLKRLWGPPSTAQYSAAVTSAASGSDFYESGSGEDADVDDDGTETEAEEGEPEEPMMTAEEALMFDLFGSSAAHTQAAAQAPHSKAYLASEGRSSTGEEVVEALPASLYDIAAAMIDRLDPTAALVVKVASVVGDVFTAETLLQLNVLPEEGGVEALEECLQALCAAHLLSWAAAPGGRSFAFTHALVRRTAYGMLLHGHRRQLHYRVAQLLGCSAEPERYKLQLAHHWLRVVDDAPSKEELESDYGGEEGWGRVLVRALKSVNRALRDQLLPLGLYQESEVYLRSGMRVLESIKDEGSFSAQRDVLEFELCMVGLQICQFTCGQGSPRMAPYFERAIQISHKRSVEAAALLAQTEVLQAKLFKAHYMMYQEHVMRDEESDAIKSLVPLYEQYSGREGIMLRLEVIGLMVADAMRKGHLDICDKYSADIKVWESIGCPEPRCLLMFDPIGMLLGGIIVEKIMKGDYLGYAAARASFVRHMQVSTFRPYHLWVVMSWTGLVWASTREIDGLGDLLTWVQNTVPERFRGTGLPETRRMRLLNILVSLHEASKTREWANQNAGPRHLEWLTTAATATTPAAGTANSAATDKCSARSSASGASTAAAAAAAAAAGGGEDPSVARNSCFDDVPTTAAAAAAEAASQQAAAQQVQEAIEIVKVYPSPLTCAAAYQICMLGGDEASAEAALRMWEETGSGQSWATKAPKSITASLLFCSRAEYRLYTIRGELERNWAAEAQLRAAAAANSSGSAAVLRRSSRPSSITALSYGTNTTTAAPSAEGNSSGGGGSNLPSGTARSVSAPSTTAAASAAAGASLAGGWGLTAPPTAAAPPPVPTAAAETDSSSTAAAAAAATPATATPAATAAAAAAAAAAADPAPVAAMVAAAVETRRRQSQLARRLVELKPDLVFAIRNARASCLTLSLIQAQLVLAEVMLAQGDARGALMMLRAARQVSRRQPPRHSVTRGPPLLATLVEVDALWARAITKRNGRAGSFSARMKNLLPSALRIGGLGEGLEAGASSSSSSSGAGHHRLGLRRSLRSKSLGALRLRDSGDSRRYSSSTGAPATMLLQPHSTAAGAPNSFGYAAGAGYGSGAALHGGNSSSIESGSERGSSSATGWGFSWRGDSRRSSAPAAANTGAAAVSAATELGSIQLQLTDEHLRGPHAPRLRSCASDLEHQEESMSRETSSGLYQLWAEGGGSRGAGSAPGLAELSDSSATTTSVFGSSGYDVGSVSTAATAAAATGGGGGSSFSGTGHSRRSSSNSNC